MIRKRFLLLLLASTALLTTACGLLREPEDASGPIEAIPLEAETPTQDASATATQQPEQETADAYPPATDANDSETVEEGYPSAQEAGAPGVAQPDEAYPGADGASDAEAAQASDVGQRRVYQISQDASRVTFELDEDLRGERMTVVGATDQVAGELAIDLANLSTAQIGVIQINARTLLTDNNFRNRAIQNEILETGAYEFITFAPTAISGLPASAAPGQEIAFTVEGDLTIRDVTQPVSFDVVATAVSEDELAGRATASIEREAFGLIIPQVRQVANVEETVELTIEFVARAA
jgi:polyisoprenoid-binding protein YceI